jgi:hypothetical protein
MDEMDTMLASVEMLSAQNDKPQWQLLPISMFQADSYFSSIPLP